MWSTFFLFFLFLLDKQWRPPIVAQTTSTTNVTKTNTKRLQQITNWWQPRNGDCLSSEQTQKKKTTKIEWHRYGGLVYAKDTQNNKEVSSDKSHFTVNTTTIKFHLDEAPDTHLPIRRSCKRHCDTLTQNLPFDMLLPYLPSADVAVIEPEHNQYGLTSSGKRIK